MTNSFSGAHPFRPQCLAEMPNEPLDGDRIAEIVNMIDAGRCPRCDGPLPDGKPIRPAGSRVTSCRCIPVCGPCGDAEPFHGVHPWDWPLDDYDVADEATAREDRMKGATLAHFGSDSDGSPVMIDETGVTEVKLRPHPGGWLEHGYDDTNDEAERRA